MELKEQIIKALECCTSGINHKGDIPCLDCPYDECNIVGGTSKRQITGTCSSWLKKDTLSLIKELTEENERLRIDNGKYEAENHAQFDKWLKLEEATKRHHSELFEEAKIAVKEDTVRKMQERLKKGLLDTASLFTQQRYIVDDVIDQIAKEMMEGENEN